MVTVICQHSNIEFEADSKRTKIHPTIAARKKTEFRYGDSRQYERVMDKVKEQGGYTTIEEFTARVDEIIAAEKSKATKAHDKWAAEARQADAEAKAKREEEKRLLSEHGYTWHKFAVGTEDGIMSGSYGAGIGEFSHYAWELWSPDNRTVTVSQALDEIKRGKDVVLAELIASETEAQAKAKALADEQIAIEAHNTKAHTEFDAAVEEIASQNTRIERARYEVEFELVRRMGEQKGRYVSRTDDRISVGEINGVKIWEIITGSGYDDGGYSSYYCADPEKAGVDVMPDDNENGLDDILRRVFF